MPVTIVDLTVHDLRFPTSKHLDGSDAMNPDPDYSAAYCILKTDVGTHEGHGFTFTIGRGNHICCAAIECLRPLIIGQTLEDIADDLGGFWRRITGDSQLRWIGPEKGAMHMATGALVNAVWDLLCKVAGKPLWRFLSDMTPEQLVRCIDFRYISDAITPPEALEMLKKLEPTKAERVAHLEAQGCKHILSRLIFQPALFYSPPSRPRLHHQRRLARMSAARAKHRIHCCSVAA
jgi:L-fuconate dehydratase